MIATKDAVIGDWYANENRKVLKSSINTKPHSVRWYRRQNRQEDPYISLIDHDRAIIQGQMIYAEDGIVDTSNVLNAHNGANVYIRYLKKPLKID